MSRKILISVLVFLFLSASSSVWALTLPSIPSRVTVVTPRTISIMISWWNSRTIPIVTPPAKNVIDFSTDSVGEAAPGRTSWEPDGDGWASVLGNVGFTATCVGPTNSKLTVSCGKMKKVGGTEEIPYESADGETDYFGFSARIETGGYVAGSPTSMQIHSLTGWSYTFTGTEIAHDFSILNLLKIPTNAALGSYATTGSGANADLMLSFI